MEEGDSPEVPQEEGSKTPTGSGSCLSSDEDFSEYEGIFHEVCEASQFVDYSCATPWEDFINDLEQALTTWGLAETDLAPEFAAGEETRKGKIFEYDGHLYELSVVDSPAHQCMEDEPLTSPRKQVDEEFALSTSLALDDSRLDFLDGLHFKPSNETSKSSFKATDYASWFGLRQFILINRSPADAVMPRQEPEETKDRKQKKHRRNRTSGSVSSMMDSGQLLFSRTQKTHEHMLLSSAMIAASSMSCSIPILLEDALAYEPVQKGAGSYIDFGPRKMEGYCCPGELGMVSCLFKSKITSSPPRACLFLSGLIPLFRSKISSAGREVNSQITISAEHTWIFQQDEPESEASMKQLWQKKSLRKGFFGKKILDPSEKVIQQRLEDMMGDPTESIGKRVLFWGTEGDPLRTLAFSIQWKDLKEGMVHDSPQFSTLNPLRSTKELRATGRWILRIQWAEEGLDPRGKLCLAPMLRRLLSATVLSHALDPSCLVHNLNAYANLRTPRSSSETEKATALDENTISMARVIGSVFSEEMLDVMDKLARSRDLPTKEWVQSTIDEMLRKAEDRRSKSCAEGPLDESGYSSYSECGSGGSTPTPGDKEYVQNRTLWLWYEKTAPVGGLLSILALRMGATENLASMSALWIDFVNELRWNWEESTHIAKMAPNPLVDGSDMFDLLKTGQARNPYALARHGLSEWGRAHWEGGMVYSDPDLRHCLIHQKIQMLNVCIEQKIKQREKLVQRQREMKEVEDQDTKSSPDKSQLNDLLSHVVTTVETSRDSLGHQARSASETNATGGVLDSNFSPGHFISRSDVVGTPGKGKPANSQVLERKKLILSKKSQRKHHKMGTPESTPPWSRVTSRQASYSTDSRVTDASHDKAGGDQSNLGIPDETNTGEESDSEKSLQQTMSFMLSSAMADASGTSTNMCIPVIQRPAPLTQDMLSHHNHMVMQLMKDDEVASETLKNKPTLLTLTADMGAFKELNPTARLNDFMVWYSPYEYAEDLESHNEGPWQGGPSRTPNRLPAARPAHKPQVDYAVLASPVQVKHASTPKNGQEYDWAFGEKQEQEPESKTTPMKGRRSSLNLSPIKDGAQLNYSDDGSWYTLARQKNEWASVWLKTRPLPLAEQPQLFRHDREAERVLDYLDNIVPRDLFAQLLMVLLSTSHFVLTRAKAEILKLPTVQAAMLELDKVCGEAINYLHAEYQDNLLIFESRTTSAVSQTTLVACERACNKIAEVETLLSRASSLLQKLPHRYALVDAILKSFGNVVVEDPHDQQALSDLLLDGGKLFQKELHSPGFSLLVRETRLSSEDEDLEDAQGTIMPPSVKRYVLRCRSPSPFHGFKETAVTNDVNFSVPNRMDAETDGQNLRLSFSLCESEM